MKCSVCKKELIGNKGVASNKANKKNMFWNGALMVVGGPILATAGAIGLGIDLFKSYKELSKDEIEITCPHCKAKLVLTRDEYNYLKAEIDKIKAEERKSKQNRVEY